MTLTDRDFCLRAVAYLKIAQTDGLEAAMVVSPDNSPIAKDLGHNLVAMYVVDMGNHFSYVQQRHLTAAELTFEQLHQQAVYNLAVLAQESVRVQAYGNIYAVLMGGNFEASLIMFPQFWSEWYAAQAPNGFVAAFPARDVLAFSDSANTQGIKELRELCERCGNTTDHPLTTTLYRKVADNWEPYG